MLLLPKATQSATWASVALGVAFSAAQTYWIAFRQPHISNAGNIVFLGKKLLNAMASITPLTIQPRPVSSADATASQGAVEDLWGAAVKLLHPENQEQIRLYSADKLTVLSEVLTAATKSREQCKDKQWKFKKRDGTVVVLYDVFNNVITWLNKMKHIGDFIASMDPVHLTLPWSIIKFFLQVECQKPLKCSGFWHERLDFNWRPREARRRLCKDRIDSKSHSSIYRLRGTLPSGVI